MGRDTSSDETTLFAPGNLILYQPDEILRARVPDPAELGRYAQKLVDTAAAFWAEWFAVRPGTLTSCPRAVMLVVALRPGRRSRFWVESDPAGLEEDALEAVRARLGQIPVPSVDQGPVAFCMLSSLGAWPDGAGERLPFVPRAWLRAWSGPELSLSDLDLVLGIVWRD